MAGSGTAARVRAVMQMTAASELIGAAFAGAGVEGFLHAVDIDSGAEVGVRPDARVATASVHKLCILIAMYQQASAGLVSLTGQVGIASGGRTEGPTGLSAMQDEARLTLRDLAYLMMAVSDNAAADLVLECIGGVAAVNRSTAGLGLRETVMENSCRQILERMEGPVVDRPGARRESDRGAAADGPEFANRSTPRDMTRLLGALWRDAAVPQPYGEPVRRILGLQVWSHRLASGFPGDDIRVYGKTGTLPHVRNEVGVVEYPDGRRFAVAVFTRPASGADRLPAADAVIGTAARIALDALRAGP